MWFTECRTTLADLDLSKPSWSVTMNSSTIGSFKTLDKSMQDDRVDRVCNTMRLEREFGPL